MKNLFIRSIYNSLISLLIPTNFYFKQSGYCPCCAKNVVFKAKNSWLRDNFFCSTCHSIPRERALMVTIEKYLPNWKELKIHESSPGNKGASLKLKEQCVNYLASQYYPDLKFGDIVGEFRNEDLESQTFADETFDLVVTQDVMEHIYEPDKAFKEIARTLKKGGFYILTVPLVNKFNKTEVWAVKDTNGNLKFINEPEFHINPVDPNGSPVTMHWGYDIVDFIRKSCNMETTIEYIDDLHMGIRAEFIEVLVCRKV